MALDNKLNDIEVSELEVLYNYKNTISDKDEKDFVDDDKYKTKEDIDMDFYF